MNRFKRTESDVDKQIYRQKRAEYKSSVKEKKQQYKTSVHQALFDNKRNSSKFWDTVRRARQRKTKQPNIEISTWQNHFQNVLGNGKSHVSSKESGNEEQFETQSDTNAEADITHVPELDSPVEVRQAIRNLKH